MAEKLTTGREMGLETDNYAMLTLHRPSNVDDKEILNGIFEALAEQLQLFEHSQARSSFVFCCLSAAGMLILLTIASCTSAQDFNEIYSQVTGFLSLSKTSLSVWLRGSPEFGHLLCYGFLSLALSGVFSRHRIFVAPLVATSFGLLMEGAQIFIPTRGASLTDIGINILGVAIGFGLYLLWVAHVRTTFSRSDLKPRFN